MANCCIRTSCNGWHPPRLGNPRPGLVVISCNGERPARPGSPLLSFYRVDTGLWLVVGPEELREYVCFIAQEACPFQTNHTSFVPVWKLNPNQFRFAVSTIPFNRYAQLANTCMPTGQKFLLTLCPSLHIVGENLGWELYPFPPSHVALLHLSVSPLISSFIRHLWLLYTLQTFLFTR